MIGIATQGKYWYIREFSGGGGYGGGNEDNKRPPVVTIGSLTTEDLEDDLQTTKEE